MKVGGLALVSMTLTACYGGGDDYFPYDNTIAGNYSPEVPEPVDQGVQPENDLALPNPTETCSDPTLDFDEDGYCGPQDCDETDPFKHDYCPPAMMGGEPVGGASAGAEPTGGSAGGAEPTGGSAGGAESTGGSAGGAEPTGGSAGGAESTGGSTGGAESTGGSTGGAEPTGGSAGGAEPTGGSAGAGMQAGQGG